MHLLRSKVVGCNMVYSKAVFTNFGEMLSVQIHIVGLFMQYPTLLQP